MKKIFLWVLIYFWGLGVAVPYVSSILFGIFNTGLYVKRVQDIYLHKTALILTIVVLVSVLLIALLPIGRKKIVPKSRMGRWYIYIVAICYIVGRLKLYTGGRINAYNYILEGGLNGTIGAYAGMAFDFFSILIIYMVCMKSKEHYIFILLLYLVYTILCASRSGLLNIIFVLILTFIATDKFEKNKKRIVCYIMICIIISPLIFSVSTASRGSSVGGNIRSLLTTIVGRCSLLELGGIALSEYEHGTYNAVAFNDKYGAKNQIKQIINAMIPGNMFEEDANPNQYYRTVFLGVSEKVAREHYTSMNITLPIYFTIRHGVVVGVIFSILLIFSVYLVCIFLGNRPCSILLAVWVRDLLTFFDWVMLWRSLLTIILTCMMFCAVNQFIQNKHIGAVKLSRCRINIIDTD